MKKIIFTEKAPAPIGPYSQAVQFGNMLFISGQIAIDPANGQLVQSTLEDEVHQVMNNLKAILTEAGFTFSDVLKSTIFLSDMALFGQVNKLYESYIGTENPPARETVAVKELPKSVNVEIAMTVAK